MVAQDLSVRVNSRFPGGGSSPLRLEQAQGIQVLRPSLQHTRRMRGVLGSRSDVVFAFLGDGNNAGKLIQAGHGELKVIKMKSFFFFCFSNDCYC